MLGFRLSQKNVSRVSSVSGVSGLLHNDHMGKAAKPAKTYQNKMREVEKAMVDFEIRDDSRLRKNLGYKEFANGSTIEMTYVLTHASSIRGKSTDELLFDEAQDFDPELEIEVAQTQAASANPITIYAGTSLTTDTLLEKKWNDFVAPPVASNRKRYLPVTPSLKPFRSAKRGSFAPTIKADFRLNKTGP